MIVGGSGGALFEVKWLVSFGYYPNPIGNVELPSWRIALSDDDEKEAETEAVIVVVRI